MSKKWFIKINGKQQGSYTIEELKGHPLITPDTLASEENLDVWVRIGDIEELQEIFCDDDKTKDMDEEEADVDPKDSLICQDEDAVVAVHYTPNYWIVWGIIIILVAYVIYKMGWM